MKIAYPPAPTRSTRRHPSISMKRMIGKLKKTIAEAFQPGTAAGDRRGERELRLAASVLLVEVMRADHELAPEEEDKLIELIQRRYGLGPEETADLIELAHAEAAAAVSLHDFTRRLTDSLQMEERAHLIELLWEVAYADGRIDRYEEHLVRRIADLLYVPHAAFIRAKHRAAERMLS